MSPQSHSLSLAAALLGAVFAVPSARAADDDFAPSASTEAERAAAPVSSSEEEAEFAELRAIFRGSEDEPELAPRWLWFWDLSATVGYDDNPLLSESPVASAFLQPSLEVFGRRIAESGPEITVVGFGEIRFFERKGIDPEQIGFGLIRSCWQRGLWEGMLGGNLLHARRVYDATQLSTAEEREAGLLTQTRGRFEAGVSRETRSGWKQELRATLERTAFEEIDDDFWGYGVFLENGWESATGNGWTLSVGGEEERYFEARNRDSRGFPIGDQNLRIARGIVRLDGKLSLGEQRQWTLRLGLRGTIEDQAEGAYYDRVRWAVLPRVEWKRGVWRIALEISSDYLDYRRRQVSFANRESQWQEKWAGRLRLRRDFGDDWQAEVAAEFTELDSNRARSAYRQRVLSATLSRSF